MNKITPQDILDTDTPLYILYIDYDDIIKETAKSSNVTPFQLLCYLNRYSGKDFLILCYKKKFGEICE